MPDSGVWKSATEWKSEPDAISRHGPELPGTTLNCSENRGMSQSNYQEEPHLLMPESVPSGAKARFRRPHGIFRNCGTFGTNRQ